MFGSIHIFEKSDILRTGQVNWFCEASVQSKPFQKIILPLDTWNTFGLAIFGSEWCAQGGTVQCPFLKLVWLVTPWSPFWHLYHCDFFYLSLVSIWLHMSHTFHRFLVYVPASSSFFLLPSVKSQSGVVLSQDVCTCASTNCVHIFTTQKY